MNKQPSERRVGYRPGDTEIEYPDAYDRAVQARIKGGAASKRAREWLAGDETRQALVEEINARGYDKPGSFFGKMRDALDNWGSLTPGQEATVRRILDQDAEKKAARKAEAAARDAGSQHVALVGERLEFRLRMEREISFETQFGVLVISILRDEAGNVVVYKGKPLGRDVLDDNNVGGGVTRNDAGQAVYKARWTTWEPVQKGQTVLIKATVKAHEVRDGVKQTIINRPKVLGVVQFGTVVP